MGVTIPSMSLLCIHHTPYNSTPSRSSNRRVFARAKTRSSASPAIQIRSDIQLQKVFEDESSGVVCYKDDNGEIICEGYDEGPRLQQHWLTTFSSYQRHGEAMVGRLKRSLLLVIDTVDKVN